MRALRTASMLGALALLAGCYPYGYDDGEYIAAAAPATYPVAYPSYYSAPPVAYPGYVGSGGYWAGYAASRPAPPPPAWWNNSDGYGGRPWHSNWSGPGSGWNGSGPGPRYSAPAQEPPPNWHRNAGPAYAPPPRPAPAPGVVGAPQIEPHRDAYSSEAGH